MTAPEANAAFHPEDIARSAIDRQLAACGWVVQSRADMNVGVSQGVAVREFQTDSGPVDYALFIDRRLRGFLALVAGCARAEILGELWPPPTFGEQRWAKVLACSQALDLTPAMPSDTVGHDQRLLLG